MKTSRDIGKSGWFLTVEDVSNFPREPQVK